MREQSHAVALCGLTAALALVVMVLGSMLGVMTYACPVLAGILLLCVREELGVRWALTEWAAIGLLALMLVPEPEMTGVFIGIFGWYPAAKPGLDRLPGLLSWFMKGLTFNGAAVGTYALLMQVVGISDMPGSLWGMVSMLAVGNLLFVLYDLALKRLQRTLLPRLHRLLSRP